MSIVPILLLVAGAGAAAGARAQSVEPTQTSLDVAPGVDPARAREEVHKVEVQGLTVELTTTPLATDGRALREGQTARVELRITDTATGSPQTGLDPGGWIHPADGDRECTKKLAGFLSGGLAGRAMVDLNTYFVLALNGDATISVVDPLFGYGGSKLLALVELDAPGEDWLIDGERLFVSMPKANAVAVVDLRTWKKTAKLATPANPTRIALQPDGHYLWVACDGASDDDPRSGVAVVDARTLELVAEIPTGAGPHGVAFDGDSRYAFVSDARAGTVTIVDVRSLAVAERIEVGGRPVGVARSALSRAIYVVDEQRGRLIAIDERTHDTLATIEAEPGLGELRFARDGRLGFVVNTPENVVHVVDTASHRIVQTADVGGRPDQIAFSESLAYVRSLDTEIVLMIPLDEVGKEGSPVPVVDFSGGQAPFGAARTRSVAPAIVPAPGDASVLVANPADGAIYFYKEGMAAPMGHFGNFGRHPRAVLVVDRSLREIAPGTYATDVALTRPGRFDVVVFVDAPRIVQCFTIDVEADPVRAAQRAARAAMRVEPLFAERTVKVGEPFPMRFRVYDPRSDESLCDLKDLGMLVFNTRGWKDHQRLVTDADGLVETMITPPDSGTYYVSFECPSRRLRFADVRRLILLAQHEPETEGERAR